MCFITSINHSMEPAFPCAYQWSIISSEHLCHKFFLTGKHSSYVKKFQVLFSVKRDFNSPLVNNEKKVEDQ